jgi:isoleucyl-tRNA synthetase
LAESELKYEDGHKSRSVYIGFDVEESDMSEGLKEAYDLAISETGRLPLQLAVWTTTAWTLPANAVSSLFSTVATRSECQGVNIGADMTYSIVLTKERKLLVIAESRREALAETLGPLEKLAEILGKITPAE